MQQRLCRSTARLWRGSACAALGVAGVTAVTTTTMTSMSVSNETDRIDRINSVSETQNRGCAEGKKFLNSIGHATRTLSTAICRFSSHSHCSSMMDSLTSLNVFRPFSIAQAAAPRLLSEMQDKYVLISGSSNEVLASQVATVLNKELMAMDLGVFADGETSVRLGGNVRGKDVYIIQSVSPPLTDNLMELLLMVSACRRSSAKRIIVIVPYLGYSRQDRSKGKRTSIAAKDLATMICSVGADSFIGVDLHRRQIEGFFDTDTTCESLETLRAALPILLSKDLYRPVIVCPSDTGIFRAKKLLHLMKEESIVASMAFVTTTTSDQNIEFAEDSGETASPDHYKIHGKQSEIIGKVKYRDVIIVDDMIDSGKRMINAARVCKDKGAFRVFAFATHGVFSEDSVHGIADSPVEECIVTNSIFPPPHWTLSKHDLSQREQDCWDDHTAGQTGLPSSTHDRGSNNADSNPDGGLIYDRSGQVIWSDKISYVSIAPIIAETIRRMQCNNSVAHMTHL